MSRARIGVVAAVLVGIAAAVAVALGERGGEAPAGAVVPLEGPPPAGRADASAADASGRTADEPLLEVPLLFHDRHVYVPATVGGTGPHWLLLDTGASVLGLDSRLAARLGLDVRPAGTMRGAGDAAVPYGFADAPEIRVGGRAVDADRVSVLPLDSIVAPFTGRPAPGVLGIPFFDGRVVELDFAARSVRAWAPESFQPDPAGTAVPYARDGAQPWVDLEVELPDGTVEPVRAMVDLGAKPTILFGPDFVERAGVLERLGDTVEATLGAGVGGETRFAFARLPRMRVGPLEREGIVAGFAGPGMLPSGRGYDALLGAEFLRRHRVAFDAPGRRLWLAPVERAEGEARPAADPDPFDRVGVFVVERAGGLVVHRVIPASPAAEAGLREGDRIVEVDGRPAAALGVDRLRRAFSDPDAERFRLAVERDGSTRSVEVEPRDLL